MRAAKKKKWMKFRHRVARVVIAPFLFPYTRIRYGVDVRRFQEQGKRQYLIVMNHQTVFDQFFVAMAFRGPVYYVATEDIFSNGWVSRLIRYLVAPIPIKKQANDLQAVRTCIRVAREGGTIALAPEGNRTYSGRTEYIKPSIVKLVRALKIPLAIFRIEGGYGIQPRWSDVIRRGHMKAGVSRVVEPEEYAALSDSELYRLIQDELFVDESTSGGVYRHRKLAEYLERAVYICPHCGPAQFRSGGDLIRCTRCGRQIRYLPGKELEGVGQPFPFRSAAEWYGYQCEFVSRMDLTPYLDVPIFRDTARMSEVILYHSKRLLCKQVGLSLYGDRILVERPDGSEMTFPFDETAAVTVLGRNKLNIYFGGKVYQFRGDKSFNALKYVNIYYHYKNISEGNANGKFLGL